VLRRNLTRALSLNGSFNNGARTTVICFRIRVESGLLGEKGKKGVNRKEEGKRLGQGNTHVLISSRIRAGPVSMGPTGGGRHGNVKVSARYLKGGTKQVSAGE